MIKQLTTKNKITIALLALSLALGAIVAIGLTQPAPTAQASSGAPIHAEIRIVAISGSHNCLNDLIAATTCHMGRLIDFDHPHMRPNAALLSQNTIISIEGSGFPTTIVLGAAFDCLDDFNSTEFAYRQNTFFQSVSLRLYLRIVPAPLNTGPVINGHFVGHRTAHGDFIHTLNQLTFTPHWALHTPVAEGGLGELWNSSNPSLFVGLFYVKGLYSSFDSILANTPTGHGQLMQAMTFVDGHITHPVGSFGGDTGTPIVFNFSALSCDSQRTFFVRFFHEGIHGTPRGFYTSVAHFVPMPPEPTRAGFNFAGWYFDAALTQPFDGQPITADITLHARFTPIVYTITYTLNGGTLIGQPTTFTIESATITLPTPTRPGFSFEGWFIAPTLTGAVATTIPHGTMGNRRFYARWEAHSYSISFELGGGNLTGYPTVISSDDPAITLPIPTRAGFNFAGWYWRENRVVALSGMYVAIQQGDYFHVTITASWTAIVYTITYTINGGTLTEQPTTFTVESPSITLPIPTRDGHYFRGWYTNATLVGTPITEITTGTIGNRRVYARWEIMRFTVRFMVMGVEYSSFIVDWGTQLSDFTFVNPMTGTIARLYGDVNLSNTFDLTNNIKADTVVYTDGAVDVFVALTYSINGETTTHLLPLGAMLDLLMDASLAGYDFMGWYRNSSFTQRIQSTDRITSNMTIYARLVPSDAEYIPTPPPSGNAFIRWVSDNRVLVAAIAIIVVVLALVIGGVIYVKKKR